MRSLAEVTLEGTFERIPTRKNLLPKLLQGRYRWLVVL